MTIHEILASQLNQSPDMPCCTSLRQASIKTSGPAMTAACRAARSPAFHQPIPVSCWRTASAEKASRPSVPQPKVWVTNRRKEIGTNKAARNFASPEPAEPQPQPEGKEGERHRQCEIDETEQEGVAVGER